MLKNNVYIMDLKALVLVGQDRTESQKWWKEGGKDTQEKKATFPHRES